MKKFTVCLLLLLASSPVKAEDSKATAPATPQSVEPAKENNTAPPTRNDAPAESPRVRKGALHERLKENERSQAQPRPATSQSPGSLNKSSTGGSTAASRGANTLGSGTSFPRQGQHGTTTLGLKPLLPVNRESASSAKSLNGTGTKPPPNNNSALNGSTLKKKP